METLNPFDWCIKNKIIDVNNLFHTASSKGDIRMAKYLLKHYPNLDITNQNNNDYDIPLINGCEYP